MDTALKITVRALKDLWEHAFLAIFCSLVWLFLTLLVVPAPPATVALFAIAGQIGSREPLIEFLDYLRLIWRYFGLGWRWAAINLPVIGLLLVDIRTIPRFLPASAAAPVQIVLIAVLALWCLLNWFALAFLFQQVQPSLRQAFRNSAILVLQHPALALILALITATGLWLSLGLVIVNLLFGPMFASLVATHAVLDRLQASRANNRASSPAESVSEPPIEA
jgi:uncharacterized membrane protein YesL